MKPIIRRPKAAEDVEGHAMYIADGSIEASFKFLERAVVFYIEQDHAVEIIRVQRGGQDMSIERQKT